MLDGAPAPNWTGWEVYRAATEIEWATYPGRANPHFIAQLEQQMDKGLGAFMCRSGVRSHRAATAATQAGYGDCYNVLEGFEGHYGCRRAFLTRLAVGG